MATKSKKRIYISLSPESIESLDLMSKDKEIPMASMASQLLEEAIEIQEDIIWEKIANERKKTKGKFYTHEEAWK
jgi:hypothetical protein